jgi:hypothetical protein
MGKPLVPEDLRRDPEAARERDVASLVRGVLAIGRSALDTSIRPGDHARRWADDRNLDLVLRAAVSPTSVGNSPALSQIAVAFLETLTPLSAGADLLRRGIGLNFAGAAQISVPGIAVPNTDFIGEGMAFPVTTAPTSVGATVHPCKLGIITTLTGELMRSSNAETLLRQVLIESCGPAIDRVLFSASAAGTDRPPGLLNGVAALAPSTGGTGNAKSEILVDDIQKLATALGPVLGNGDIILVGSPDAAAALKMRLPSSVAWPVLTSASLAAQTVIAVAAAAVVSAVEGTPQIDASIHAELHRESVPGEIVDIGGVTARPVGSIYQTDQIALRMRWPISWALRSPAGLAWMQNVNW